MDNIGITIICSNYNSKRWIDGYLENVNSIDYPNINIIFVDANSTDGSLETIKSFEFKEHVNAKIIECSNRVGIYDAWNIAVEEAETEYVMTLNTDDRLFSQSLKVYDYYAKQHPEMDVIYSPIFVVQDPDHKEITGRSEVMEHSHNNLLMACYCGPFPLLKRQSLIDVELFNPRFTISGDYDMWLRLSHKGYNLMRIPHEIGTYYFNPTGMSSNKDTFQEHLKQDIEIRSIYG